MKKRGDNPAEVDLESLRKKEPEAVGQWFLEHADAVYRFVYHRVGRDPDLSADVVQDTFLKALGRIEGYDPDRGPMLTWLSFHARNCIRAALRHRGRYKAYADVWEATEGGLFPAYAALATAPLPLEIVERKETAEIVHLTLSSMPGNYRRALTQRYYERKSLKEIARAGGTTEGAVKSLLHRARLAFKTAFQDCAEALHGRLSAREETG